MTGEARSGDLAVAQRRLLERRTRLVRQIRAAQHQLQRIDRRLDEITQSQPDAPTSKSTLGDLVTAGASGRTERKPKFGPQQVERARQMYDEKDEHGKPRYTVAQIAAELGTTPPTIHRHLQKTTRSPPASRPGRGQS
jgi:IS30 family transposase